MDSRGISGRQFAAELTNIKKRLDRLEKAKRGRVGGSGGKKDLYNGATISRSSMISGQEIMNTTYDPRHAIEILWTVVKAG